MKQIQWLTLDRPVPTPTQAAFLDQGTGVPILMLHGFMGSSTCWLPVMARLQTQMHCVALDLLGFGESAKPAITYDVAQEVAFVQQFIETCQLAPCYLAGHSFGGWVAAAYALAHPDAVKGLILVAPAGIRDDSFCGRYDHLRPLLWQTPVIDWVLKMMQPVSGWMGHREDLDKLLWMRSELNAQPAARSFLVDRLRPEDAIDTVEKEIHQLPHPTLVITGDRDETIPLWHSETYAHEIPNAQLTIIPNADHSLPSHQAPQLADLIASFVHQQEKR